MFSGGWNGRKENGSECSNGVYYYVKFAERKNISSTIWICYFIEVESSVHNEEYKQWKYAYKWSLFLCFRGGRS